jgi:hypothetical protein
MQIRLSSQFENECAWSVGRPMTTDEFLARFPEVPRDLTDEPILPVYVQLFGPLLCGNRHDLALVGGHGACPSGASHLA